MFILLEEFIVFLFVLSSVPIVLYALERLSGKTLYNRWLILIIYFALSWSYFDITELQYRINIYENNQKAKTIIKTNDRGRISYTFVE